MEAGSGRACGRVGGRRKRDDNTEVTEVTEGRTQRAQSKARKRKRRDAEFAEERGERVRQEGGGKNAIRENGVPGKAMVRESGGEPPHSKETQEGFLTPRTPFGMTGGGTRTQDGTACRAPT